MRIDKFLWCVRLHKSRSLATEACQKGRVKLNDREVKPAAEVKVGERIAVRQPPIWRVFRVKALPTSRVGAKLVPDLLEEVTPWEELERLELARKVQADGRRPGEGRPTKRDRRDMERFHDEG
jgi:ribosome-associated heat shock protein Hsp15